MKQIPLTQGKFAIVDDEDFEFLNRLDWYYESAGQRNITEVAQRNFGRHTVPMHFLLIHQKKEGLIRHINGKGLDNRKENLEIISSSISQQSKRKAEDKLSIYKGVSFQKVNSGKNWKAEITKNKVRYGLGKFATEAEAGQAYNKKAIELYGEFAYQNKIEDDIIKESKT